MKTSLRKRTSPSVVVTRALLLLVLLFVSIGAQAKQRWIGGTGGEDFAAYCSNGQVMAGVELWTGDDVDAIRPLCAVAYGPTQLGPIEPFPRKFGGDGGGSNQRYLCPPQMPVVLGIYAKMEGEATPIINSIWLRCGIVAPQQAPTLLEGPGFDGPMIDDPTFHMQGELTCDPGEVVGGVAGRSGRWLDSIRLICTQPTITPKPVIPSIGRYKPRSDLITATSTPRNGPISALLPTKYSSYLYTLETGGTLRWFRHDGAATGDPGFIGPRVIATDVVKNFRAVFAGGNGVIYGLTNGGALWRYDHVGYRDGLAQDVPGAWGEPRQLMFAFGQPVQVFSAGDDVIYAIDGAGKLLWYRISVLANGEVSILGPREVGHGWNGLKAFSGGKGVLYTITPDGTLRWYRHIKYLTGEGLEVPGAWAARQDVGSGWNAYDRVFSDGKGAVYAVTPQGEMFWYHHDGYQTGAKSWTPRRSLGTGWNTTPWLFVQP